MKKITSILLAIAMMAILAIPAFAMEIVIEITLDTGNEQISLEVDPTDRIGDVKEKIRDKKGLAVSVQTLRFDGKILEDENSLQDYSIFEDSVLTLSTAQGTTVVYQVDPSYTVTIPTKVVGNSASLSIEAEPILKETEKVVISIGSSVNYDEGFRLKEKNEEIYIAYTISDGTKLLGMGDTALEQAAAAPEQATVQLSFSPDKPLYSGDYSDTLTFIIAVVDTAAQ